jgi:hypothetical protein
MSYVSSYQEFIDATFTLAGATYTAGIHTPMYQGKADTVATFRPIKAVGITTGTGDLVVHPINNRVGENYTIALDSADGIRHCPVFDYVVEAGTTAVLANVVLVPDLGRVYGA